MGLQRVDKHFLLTYFITASSFLLFPSGWEEHSVVLFSLQFFVDSVPWQVQICLRISSFPFPKYGLTKN